MTPSAIQSPVRESERQSSSTPLTNNNQPRQQRMRGRPRCFGGKRTALATEATSNI